MEGYEKIMEQLVGREIIEATHVIFGRIDNEFRLKLDNGKILVFGAERSEFDLNLKDAIGGVSEK